MYRVTTSPAPGEVLELAVGEVVHGGWCVARLDDTGWVIFVRHALPGERVLARITQVTSRFGRADAIEIIQPAPDRVQAPCPYAGPGRCGGCDWQHASLPAQRELKAAVVRQQLARLAHLDLAVPVESVPGADDGLRWRTTVSFAVGRDGAAGLRRHRSRQVVGIADCLIAHPAVAATEVTGRRWPGTQAVEVSAVPETGERGVIVSRQGRPAAADLAGLAGQPADTVQVTRRGSRTPVRGRGYLARQAAGRQWRVSLGGFWQVHPGAADLFGGAVLAALGPRAGESALDLYCGAGLFAGLLAAAVGEAGAVIGIEEEAAAVRDARHNLRDWPWARVLRGDVATVLGRLGPDAASIAVLDPPRAGADPAVVGLLCRSALRRIAYVSCDPATLARDLRLLLDGGWQLADLRAFDAFPMTHHIECLATLTRE
jgi:tRNA/tmRNA/rRNA uracil-C5-methylase (TrmA/RlmC/RlmD family)